MESRDRSVRVILTYALLILCARLFSVQMRTIGYWYSRRCYERSRGEMMVAIYDKILARKNVVGLKTQYLDPQGGTANVSSGNEKRETQRSRWTKLLGIFRRNQKTSHMKEYASTGKILHLIRGDVYQVSERLRNIDDLINVPTGVVMACALIWKILGPSCFLGLIVLLIPQGVNIYLTKIFLRWKRHQKTGADDRIQATVQFIEVIRHLRWYGWQNHWLDQVLKARVHELRTKAKAMALSVGITNTNFLGRSLFPVVALYSYTYLAGNPLSIDVIFPALECFKKLDESLNSTPRLMTDSVNAYIALGRIDEFMAEPNREQEHNIVTASNLIKLEGCDFAWPGESEPVLKGINLEIKPGLTVIHGKLGAGKSALLQAILGELDKLKGERQVPRDRIGYCSQTPWLQSMSVRDNILFVEPYEEGRYRKVVEACELTPDFREFKHGDLSIIGENGIGLSGGQRARVALARAVYSRASILVLDDPFSALDFKTAKSIVQKLFQGPLVQDCTVVMVTYRIDLVRHLADQVIEVNTGRTEVLSPYEINSRVRGATEKFAADVQTKEHAQKPATPYKFLKDEKTAEWGIPLRVNWTFIKAGGLRWWAATVFFSAAYYATGMCCTLFLKAWGEAYRESGSSLPQSQTEPPNFGNIKMPLPLSKWSGSSLFDGYPSPLDDVRPWLWTYLGISIAQTVQVGYSITEIMIGLRASTYLFQKSMNRVSRATFRYYDVTPAGQLMNRFTSDMSTVDGKVTFHTRRLVLAAVGWSIYLGVIASITPSFMAFCVFIMGIYYSIFLRYFLTSQSLQHLHTASVSPLFTHLGELLHGQGLTTVRAFHCGPQFQRQIMSVYDKFQGMDHFFWSVSAWFMYRIELITAISAFALTFVAVLTELPPSLTAFMLNTVTGFIGSTHMLSRVYGELQMEFISVDRVEEQLHIEQENPGTVQPPAVWPRCGTDIILDNVTVRYADHLDPALRDITLRIPGGSTVALVGRTGSGKSTLAQALIGVVRPHIGKILIDGISVDEVDIDSLRQRVTFVAQDPVLFSGTIRHNLDPAEQYSDEECGAVLDRVCGGQGWTLNTNIESGGPNLSQGQRQLIGIARAVLRRSTIVILDEATASIDYETSMSIQQILRDEMTESTVITIAHRIEAVKDADYAIVMENAKVLRHGPAINMLT
jgi:ABC-type multidrug transport system fused ATPase/permease subunit